MKISDERNNGELIRWQETESGEVYEFSIPDYSEKPFIGMIMMKHSFDFDPEDYILHIIDLENGYGMSIEESSKIEYVKRVGAKLILTC